MYRQASALACALLMLCAAPSARGQQDSQMESLQEHVRGRIVYLVAEGQTATGVPMRSEATGFFVNDLGNILTTYHLLTKLGNVDTASIRFKAHIGSKNAAPIPVSVYDARQNRDLLLLDMADGDSGKPLCIEPNFRPNRLQRPLFTTGFSRVLATISLRGDLISRDGPNGTWVTDMQFNEGQSGSPVYEQAGKVIGVAKGQLMDDAGQPVPGNYVIIPISDANSIVSHWSAPERCTYTPPLDTSAPIRPSENEIAKQVQQCVGSATAAQLEPWIVTGGARARGPGIEGSVQTDTRQVCYASPPSFVIDGQASVRDLGNNGGRGSISEIRYSADEVGRATGACVEVTAWSEEGLFRGGGWQNVELSGQISRIFTSQQFDEIKDRCRSRILSAYE